jgi:chromosome segregation ATPase
VSEAWRSLKVEKFEQAEAALREELAQANRRAEDALLEAAAARDQSELLERRNAELGESLREQRATFEELEIWRGELERRLASMSTELGAARTRLREAEQELDRARAALAEVEARPAVDLDELGRRAAADAGERAARELAEADAEHSGADC